MVRENAENSPRRPGHSRLEKNLHRGESRRHQELFRRNGLGQDEGQRPLPPQPTSRVSGTAPPRAHVLVQEPTPKVPPSRLSRRGNLYSSPRSRIPRHSGVVLMSSYEN